MRGFTLLEVLIALTVLGVVLSVIFSILSESFGRLNELERNVRDFLILQKAIFLGNTTGVIVREKTIRRYNVRARIFRKGKLELIEID